MKSYCLLVNLPLPACPHALGERVPQAPAAVSRCRRRPPRTCGIRRCFPSRIPALSSPLVSDSSFFFRTFEAPSAVLAFAGAVHVLRLLRDSHTRLPDAGTSVSHRAPCEPGAQVRSGSCARALSGPRQSGANEVHRTRRTLRTHRTRRTRVKSSKVFIYSRLQRCDQKFVEFVEFVEFDEFDDCLFRLCHIVDVELSGYFRHLPKRDRMRGQSSNSVCDQVNW